MTYDIPDDCHTNCDKKSMEYDSVTLNTKAFKNC